MGNMIEVKPEVLAQNLLYIFIDLQKIKEETLLLGTLCRYWTQKEGTFYDLSIGLQYAERRGWLKRNIEGYFLTAYGLEQVSSQPKWSPIKTNPELFGRMSELGNLPKSYSIR